MREFFNVWLTLFIVGFLLMGGLMVVVNFANDEPTEIREAVLGVGLLIVGVMLMGIQIISGQLHKLIEHTQQGARASEEVAIKLRKR